MCTVWVSFNAVLVIVFTVNGRINSESLKFTACLLPVQPAAVFLGERLHGRIKERNFRIFIYALLLVSGLTLVVKVV